MKVINPDNSTHELKLIPRRYEASVSEMTIFNESTKVENVVDILTTELDGIMSVSFDYQFKEGDRYQIKINDGIEVIYRGRMLATNQDAQEYNRTKKYITYG